MKKKLVIAAILAAGSVAAQVSTAWVASFDGGWNKTDYGREIALDAAGNVFVAGHSLVDQSGNGVTTIVKYSPSGQKIWEYFSAVGTQMEDYKLDADGNSYFCGYIWQNNGWDFYTARIDSSGTLDWAVQYNGTGNHWDEAFALSIDPAGNVFVCGNSKGNLNGYDFVTVKYDSLGQQQWVARYPSTASYSNQPENVLADGSGGCYVTGHLFNGSTHDLALFHYDVAGNQLWLQTIPSNQVLSQVTREYVKTDSQGNVYLLGNVRESSGGANISLSRFSASGSLAWTRSWTTSANDSDYTGGHYYSDNMLEVDNNGRIFIAGVTEKPSVLFSQDMLAICYDTAGNLVWDYRYNGPGHDEDHVYSLAIDGTGGVYLTGEVASTAAIGGFDYMTMRLDAVTGGLQWQMVFNGVANFFDEPHAIAVDQAGGVYVTGYSSQLANVMDIRADMVTIKYQQTTSGLMDNRPGLPVSVYPNPASGKTSIRFPADAGGEGELTLRDIAGRLVKPLIPFSVEPGQNSVEVDVSDLKTGFYICELACGSRSGTVRLLVAR